MRARHITSSDPNAVQYNACLQHVNIVPAIKLSDLPCIILHQLLCGTGKQPNSDSFAAELVVPVQDAGSGASLKLQCNRQYPDQVPLISVRCTHRHTPLVSVIVYVAGIWCS